MFINKGRSTPSSSAAQPAAVPKPVAGPSSAASDRVPCPSPPSLRVDMTRPFLCEWADCLRAYHQMAELSKVEAGNNSFTF
jgi:hypothetical protein